MPDVAGELRFDGRVAVVTGAGRGLGRAYAELLATRGASVVVADLDPGGGEEVAAAIRQRGGEAAAVVADVADEQSARGVVTAALEGYGRIDAVVNNAGILRRTPFVESTAQDFLDHHAVHVMGSIFVTQAAWPHLVEQAYGRIVLTTSGSILGYADSIPYVTAKGGILALTLGLAVEGRDHGVIVNAVAPSAVTPMSITRRTHASPPELAAAGVAYLAHECCVTTGRIYHAGSGRMARVHLGVAPGFADANLSPEQVHDHWGQINDLEDSFAPGDASEWNAFHGSVLDAAGVSRPDA